MKKLIGVEAWEYFKMKIELETERCVHKKLRRVGNKPVWMNKNVPRIIRNKRRL